MKNKKCLTCSEFKRCRQSRVSWLFFIIGMISTVAVRVVIVFAHFKPLYGEIAWYVGVTGFFIFFLYKFKVDRMRSRLIAQNRLMDKITRGETITDEDRELISNILCALSSSKDRINYFLIFFTSALAILLALYLDFFAS